MFQIGISPSYASTCFQRPISEASTISTDMKRHDYIHMTCVYLRTERDNYALKFFIIMTPVKPVTVVSYNAF